MGWVSEAPLLLFRGVGGPEIAIIAVVLLLIFGAGRLPQIGKSLGQSLRAFKESVTGAEEEEASGEESMVKKAKSTAKDDK